jgi:hypothetical protein
MISDLKDEDFKSLKPGELIGYILDEYSED